MHKPRSAVFLVTPQCNFRCSFCLNIWKSKDWSGTMTVLSREQQLAAIATLWDSGVRHITFSGGEPLACPHLIELLQYAKSLGFFVYLQTNGYFITEEFLRQAKPVLDHMQISIEGVREVHNALTETQSFDRVVANIEQVMRVGIPLTLNFTVTQKNASCIVEFVQLVNELGVGVVNFTRLYYAGAATKQFDALVLNDAAFALFIAKVEALRRTSRTVLNIVGPLPKCNPLLVVAGNTNTQYCQGGREEIAVQPDGRVTPCPGAMFFLGDVRETIDCGEKSDAFVSQIGCRSCSQFGSCRGGCALTLDERGFDVYADARYAAQQAWIPVQITDRKI